MDVSRGVEEAVARLEPGGRLVRASELAGGVSATVLGLELETSAGSVRRVVFRQHRDNVFKRHGASVTAAEYSVLAALHRQGLAVPEPYVCDDSCAITDPFMLIEWVDGSTEIVAAELPGALDQMAAFLVGLHGLDPEALDLTGIDEIEDPWEAVHDYLPATGAGERARKALGTGTRRVDGERRSLLHGDYWPGNVLWRDGRLVAVIDWEDARLGDPLADLAAARVELLCRYGDEAMERFTHRYLAAYGDAIGPMRLDASAIWELYVSASALATMGDWGLEPDVEAARRRQTERFFERAVRRLG